MLSYMILAIEDDNDRAIMTELFLRYERLMYSEARKIIKNQCDPDDIISTALIKLIEKLPTLRSLGERQRVNYLITTVKHTALSEVQRITKGTMNSLDDDSWYERDQIRADETVEDLVDRRESVSALEKIWGLLDAKNQYLLRARYFLALDDSEIAEVIGIKPDSVRMELSRARKQARALLEENGMKDPWN